MLTILTGKAELGIDIEVNGSKENLAQEVQQTRTRSPFWDKTALLLSGKQFKMTPEKTGLSARHSMFHLFSLF